MARSLKFIIPLIIFLIIAAFLWRGLYSNPHKVPSPFINKEIPEFSARALYKPDDMITEKIFKGHVSLLNVFASWCVACHVEHPILMDIYDSHTVDVFGLNYKDERDAAKKWLKKFGDPYDKVLYDPKGTIAINFGVYGTPETFIIGKQGRVRYKYVGPITQDVWKTTLLPLVNKLKQEKLPEKKA